MKYGVTLHCYISLAYRQIADNPVILVFTVKAGNACYMWLGEDRDTIPAADTVRHRRKISRSWDVVSEICSLPDRHTKYRHAHRILHVHTGGDFVLFSCNVRSTIPLKTGRVKVRYFI